MRILYITRRIPTIYCLVLYDSGRNDLNDLKNLNDLNDNDLSDPNDLTTFFTIYRNITVNCTTFYRNFMDICLLQHLVTSSYN